MDSLHHVVKSSSHDSNPAEALYRLVSDESSSSPIAVEGAAILPSYAIPGLHYDPTLVDLEASSYAYNHLLDDHKQPNFSDHHLNVLAQLFIHYNVQDIFGLHLVHGHLKIPPNTIMLGSMFRGELSGYWTKPTVFETVLANPIHGHIYTLSSDNRLLAYEYREGSAPKYITNIDQAFFCEFFEYLMSNELAGLLGLEVLDTSSPLPQMLEFVLAGEGTVMVNREAVSYADIYRVTGWSFARDENGIVSVKGNETHAGKASGGHQVFTDGKPLGNVDAVLSLLQQEGLIKNNR